jgi:hypothetical protein
MVWKDTRDRRDYMRRRRQNPNVRRREQEYERQRPNRRDYQREYDHTRRRVQNLQSAWPCPVPECGKMLARGGRHFVTRHGMTAKEVRARYGPTANPAETHLRREELAEWMTTRDVWWTDEAILDAIRAYAKRNGHPPTKNGWDKAAKGRPCAATVMAHFGSWNAALSAAGFPQRKAVSPGYERTQAYRRRMSKIIKAHPPSQPRFRCGNCSRISTGAGLFHHQKVTGHKGKRAV